jgi:hypothetical protein
VYICIPVSRLENTTNHPLIRVLHYVIQAGLGQAQFNLDITISKYENCTIIYRNVFPFQTQTPSQPHTHGTYGE